VKAPFCIPTSGLTPPLAQCGKSGTRGAHKPNRHTFPRKLPTRRRALAQTALIPPRSPQKPLTSQQASQAQRTASAGAYGVFSQSDLKMAGRKRGCWSCAASKQMAAQAVRSHVLRPNEVLARPAAQTRAAGRDLPAEGPRLHAPEYRNGDARERRYSLA
jgi:hypothetical protein